MMRRLLMLLPLIGALFGLAGCSSTRTRPIVDEQGHTIAGSVASLERVQLGGVLQWILIRGQRADSPLLLKIHGGPGQAEMATAGLNRLLEKDFIVVEWDQRGAGKSAAAIEPASAMTIAQLVEDTRELSELLLARFGRRQLILVGHSWGSVIGLEAVHKYPALYSAFVSTGQIANFSTGLALGYRFLLDEAQRRQDADAIRELTAIGPPSAADAGSAARLNVHARWLERFGLMWHSAQKFDRVGWMISAAEYSWPEKLAFTGAADRSLQLLLPQLAAVDLPTTVPGVKVPVTFAVGRHDQMAPTAISQAYFAALQAPAKRWVWFEQSAHFPQWEEAEKFHQLLTQTVLPASQAR